MKKFLLAILQDKTGQYSLRKLTVCMSLVVLLVSWIVQQLFNTSIPEFMYFTFGGLVVTGCFGYSLEKSPPPSSRPMTRLRKGIYRSSSKRKNAKNNFNYTKTYR